MENKFSDIGIIHTTTIVISCTSTTTVTAIIVVVVHHHGRVVEQRSRKFVLQLETRQCKAGDAIVEFGTGGPCVGESKVQEAEFGRYVNEHDSAEGMTLTIHCCCIVI